MNDRWFMRVEKDGTNPDQRQWQTLQGPDPLPDVVIGDVFHIEGQPLDVKWRVIEIADLLNTP